jgi:hypothetical protein
MTQTLKFKTLLSALFVVALISSSCDKDEDPIVPIINKTDDIVELAIRQVKTGQTDAFIAARTNFINLLTQETGVSNDREYQSFFHYDPAEDLATFQAVGNNLGNTAEAGAFFSTFDVLTFTALKPVVAGTVVDLSQVATGNQVLEIAVRDLSKYSNFDQADYEAKRDAFLAELAKQPARVAEYQWVSVLDPNIVIGMTVYTDQQAFFQLANDPVFGSNPAVGAFLGTYPPTNYGELCTVIK